jgi:DNA helicase-2/ATP-dependent DNA helicase PcrA
MHANDANGFDKLTTGSRHSREDSHHSGRLTYNDTMHDLLRDLNDRQREAVTAPLGPALVLAGAGSGKTRVLTYRLAYLLQQKIFKPENLLALTFTNKAAGEMRNRIIGLIGKSEKPDFPASPAGRRPPTSDLRLPVTMGTFHSVCARLLRQEIQKLGLGYNRNFIIYDAPDSERLLKQILLEKNLTERFRPSLFAYYVSSAKNRLVEPANLALDNSYLEDILQEVYEEYQKRLVASNAVDFDDLLELVCELFLKEPKVLEKYQNRFKYVLVDEYQDTNHAQYVFLKLLVKRHQNLFVVGDDAQSIYGFRGANMQNILDFKKDYPQAKLVYLEQNYRSTQNILDCAHRVIKLNPRQYEKKLWTANLGGEKVNLYEALDEIDEAEFVVDRIIGSQRSEVGNQKPELEYTPILDSFIESQKNRIIRFSDFRVPENLNQIVILYRTHAQSRPFEEVLLQSGIPYQIVGGVKFYERREIKDTLSYLRLLVNPRDLVSLSRIINAPPRGIGPVAFQNLSKTLPKYNYNFERIFRNLEKFGLSGKAFAGAGKFFGLLGAAGKLPEQTPLLELMRLVLGRSGYKDSLLDGSEEGQARWENIEELFNVAAKYSARGGFPPEAGIGASGGKNLPWKKGLEAFLEEVVLMTDLDTLEEKGNKLTLMTLHSAKGLEFETVYLVGVEEGLLPHSRSLLSPEELAEEIRLAYVGMTRAKKNLFLTYARKRRSYGELKRCVPSRVIKAIPKNLLHRLNSKS